VRKERINVSSLKDAEMERETARGESMCVEGDSEEQYFLQGNKHVRL
jgi:hypothetical protein